MGSKDGEEWGELMGRTGNMADTVVGVDVEVKRC